MNQQPSDSHAMLVFPCMMQLVAIIFYSASRDPTAAIALAILLAQPALLGVWAALALAPLRRRLPYSVALGLASFYLLTFGLTLKRSMERPDALFFVTFLAVVVAAFAFHFTLWFVVRLRFGLCLAPPETPPGEIPPDDRQFGVRDLLLWTAGIAVAVTLGKLLIAPPGAYSASLNFDARGEDIETILSLLALLTVGSLPALCMMGVVLHRGERSRWFSGFFLVAFLACSVLLPFIAYWFGPTGEIELVFAVMCLGQLGLIFAVVVSLVPLALAGWRIVRYVPAAPARQSPPAAAPPQTAGTRPLTQAAAPTDRLNP